MISDFNSSINILSKVELRVLSQFLTPSYINSLYNNNDSIAKNKFKKFLKKKNILFDSSETLGEIIDRCYCMLLANYKNEYTYKNELIKNIISDKFKLSETVVLNEFKVGKSIADTVLLNGIDKAFEIKTELDNPDRLITQLQDYQKVFKNVYLVTHIKPLNKYMAKLPSEIGVLAFDDQMQIQEVKPAVEMNSNLCKETMMRCLRKTEYLDIVKYFFNEVPNSSSIDLFKTCVSWINQLPSKDFHNQFISTLKKRRITEIDIFGELSAPLSLFYIYHCLNLTENQYIRLINCLKKNN